MMNEHMALKSAIEHAIKSPCEKSKRGVAIFLRESSFSFGAGIYATGYNSPPEPMACDGSEECRSSCGKLCVHAEASALINLRGDRSGHSRLVGLEMIHVKVVDGVAVPSGPPSCWQCSRLILSAGIMEMWLLHEDGLKSYTSQEFHAITLRGCGLPVIEEHIEDPGMMQ